MSCISSATNDKVTEGLELNNAMQEENTLILFQSEAVLLKPGYFYSLIHMI